MVGEFVWRMVQADYISGCEAQVTTVGSIDQGLMVLCRDRTKLRPLVNTVQGENEALLAEVSSQRLACGPKPNQISDSEDFGAHDQMGNGSFIHSSTWK